MRRIVILALTALTTAAIAAPTALAHGNGGANGSADGPGALFGGFVPQDEYGDAFSEVTIHAKGTVVSVDATTGVVTANVKLPRWLAVPAEVATPDVGSGSGDEYAVAPEPSGQRRGRGNGRRSYASRASASSRERVVTRVALNTDADTLVIREGSEATVADLLAGDQIDVAIIADRSLTPAEILATPAWSIVAKAAIVQKILYGFAGKVTAIDLAAGTVTLDVKYATKSARAAIGAGTKSITFLTDTNTDVFKGGVAVGLADIATGDLVGVGVRAAKGSTQEQLVATPARTVVALATKPATAAKSRLALQRLGARAARAKR